MFFSLMFWLILAHVLLMFLAVKVLMKANGYVDKGEFILICFLPLIVVIFITIEMIENWAYKHSSDVLFGKKKD